MNFYVHSHVKEDLLNINLLLWNLTGGPEKNNEVPLSKNQVWAHVWTQYLLNDTLHIRQISENNNF